MRKQVDAIRAVVVDEEEVPEDTMPVISLGKTELLRAWTVEKVDDVYIVRGDKIEKFARRTNFDQFEGVNRLRDIMKKLGVTHELVRQGARSDSVIRIGIDELTLIEQ